MSSGNKQNSRDAALPVAVALALMTLSRPAFAEEAKIGFSTLALTNTYTITLANIIEDYAKKNGFNLLPPVDSRFDAAKQIDDVTTLLGSGIKGLLIQVVDGKAVKVALNRANKAEIPVVAIDSGPDSGKGGKVAITVLTSSLTMAERSCEALGKTLGGKGKVLELQGKLSNQVGLDRSNGFVDCIKQKFPGITVISQPADWSEDKAATMTQTVLSTNPDVNGIYLASDTGYLPAVLNTLKKLDKLHKVGEINHIAIVGIDGAPFTLQQIRAGYVDASVSQPMSDYAKYGFQYLTAALAGTPIVAGKTDHNSEVVADAGGNLVDALPPSVIDRNSVDEPSLWGNQAK